MPHIGEMFPSKYLQPEDLKPGITAVTIRSVELLSAARKQGYSEDGELETQWLVKLDEFRKPMKLKSINARTIADVLGSDLTEDWVGQAIGIYSVAITAYGKRMNVINVDIAKPQTRPSLAAAATDKRPIGTVAADRWKSHLGQLKKTHEDYLRWLKSNVDGGIELAFGVDYPDLPAALLPSMKRFLDECAAGARPALVAPGAAAAPAAGEVIDRKTGEVMPFDKGPELDDKDIPF